MPTIAVIIPNYNYERFVARAIDSVLSQNVPFHEIFVVDDGSRDNSVQVIKRYGPPVTLIAKENGGQLAACITAIRQSTSDYVYILDADDWIYPNMLERIMPGLAEHPAKLQFQLRGADADGNETGSVFPAYPAHYATDEALRDNRVIGFYLCPPTSGNIFRREILEKMPLERLNGRDFIDGTPVLAMPYLGKVVTLAEPLGAYCIHAQGDSQSLNVSETLLEKEISRFNARWDEIERVLAIPKPAFANGIPLYVAERQMIMAALKGKWLCVAEVIRFIRGLLSTSYSARQKLILSLWGLSLTIPISSLRNKSILYRRAGTSRPRWLKKTLTRQTAPRQSSNV